MPSRLVRDKPPDPVERLRALHDEQRRRDAALQAEIDAFTRRSALARAWADHNLQPRLRDATAREYACWLQGFIEQGGEPTHFYDYPFQRAGFQVAREPFAFQDDLCGSNSVNIIASSPDLFLGGPLGHCSIYFLSDFSHIGHWVPVYSDVYGLVAEP